MGVQVIRPVVGLMTMPAGAPVSNEKVSVCAGMSGSLALLVTISNCPSAMARGPRGRSTGAALTSLTWTLKERVSLNGGTPLSVTRTVMA